MRRLFVVGVLVAGLWPAVACGADRPAAEPPSATADPTTVTDRPTAGGGAPSADGVPTGGNTATVCAVVRRAGDDAVRAYEAELGRMVAAVGANDSTAADAARRRAEAALAGWRTVLGEQSARATAPQLGALLDDLGAEVEALGADVNGFDETELDRLRQRLDRLCPG
ncbi:hypothetical protein [Micromonospora sp. NPDC023737]|uniref:hypothetical protein n=1 Tax=unclassified Micromonospora TaxID=2617518 RepID=UPI0034010EAA